MSHKLFITSDISIDERLVEVAETSPEAALLWPWLLTALDDWGRSTADAKRLKYGVFPAIACVTPQTIKEALTLFASAGLITLYEVDGKPYLAVPSETWFKYQTHIRSEKRETDKSRIPAPPGTSPSNSAHMREDARDCAQVRAVASNCIPSPSPSPSLSLSPSYPSEDKPSDAVASHTHAHASERQSEPSPAQLTQTNSGGGDTLILETEATLARWRTLTKKRRASLPSPDALHSVLQRHRQRGMTVEVLHCEILKLEDEATTAARPLTLTRLDNWLNQWHAPPPDAPSRRGNGRHSALVRPEPPTMIPASQANQWWVTPQADAPVPAKRAIAASAPNGAPSGASAPVATPDATADDCAADVLRSPPGAGMRDGLPAHTRPPLQVIAAS